MGVGTGHMGVGTGHMGVGTGRMGVGSEYGWNCRFLTRDGEPWFPVMGEFHYSRCPREHWYRELLKMRAGGVEVVASYVIWIHHEEEEGCFLWDGNRNLKEFLEEAFRAGLKVFLRIGPWIHGEVRNGGLPDWVLGKEFKARSNDEGYFKLVEGFFGRIGREVKGLSAEEVLNVIGVQIENEYHGADGMSMEEQEAHMERLTDIAVGAGLLVPYYTATGWGNAATGGLIPVMGGYCEAPWDPSTGELEPNVNYVFTEERNDGNIGTDLQPGEGISFDSSRFPFLTAELGGGVQVTGHRRPVVSGRDIGAMSLVKLGCGVNLLGFYMYHGGTNPSGKISSLQESRDTGYPNDVPVLSYDFMAPLGEYGQVRDSFYEIRRLSLFLEDFGSSLCRMDTVIPEDNPGMPSDGQHCRYSFRHEGEGGFLFVNNYQRRMKMGAYDKKVFSLEVSGEKVVFPPMDIRQGDYGIYPFGLDLGECVLKAATAVPLCILHNEQKVHVFYSDVRPEYVVDGKANFLGLGNAMGAGSCDKDILEGICIDMGDDKDCSAPDGREVGVVEPVIWTVTGQEALSGTRLKLDQEYFAVADGVLAVEGDLVRWFHCPWEKNPRIKVYPALSVVPDVLEEAGKEGVWTVYQMNAPFEGEELLLRIRYEGESGQCFYKGRLVADNFYNGNVWEVGYFEREVLEKLEVRILPFSKGQQVFLEVPRPSDGVGAVLEREIVSSFEYSFRWKER